MSGNWQKERRMAINWGETETELQLLLLLLLLGQSGGFTARCWSGRRRRWHCALIAQVPQAAPAPALPTNLADEESFVALAAPPTQPTSPLPSPSAPPIAFSRFMRTRCERQINELVCERSPRWCCLWQPDEEQCGKPSSHCPSHYSSSTALPFRSPPLHLGAKVKTFRKSGAERSAN